LDNLYLSTISPIYGEKNDKNTSNMTSSTFDERLNKFRKAPKDTKGERDPNFKVFGDMLDNPPPHGGDTSVILFLPRGLTEALTIRE